MDNLIALSDEEKFILETVQLRNPKYDFRLTPCIDTGEGHVRGVLVKHKAESATMPWRKVHSTWFVHKLTQVEYLVKFLKELEDEVIFQMEIEHRV